MGTRGLLLLNSRMHVWNCAQHIKALNKYQCIPSICVFSDLPVSPSCYKDHV